MVKLTTKEQSNLEFAVEIPTHKTMFISIHLFCVEAA